uniref:RNA exonuclease 4 n=1 Tax=Ditylenchus dipsaci TaxID=166011 RepID=A0A915EQ87_9BILA
MWTFFLDVDSQDSIDKAHKLVNDNLPTGHGLHAVLNNAGIMRVDSMTGSKRLTTKTGRIVLVSSIAGRMAIPGFGPFNISKFAIEGYADTIRLELFLIASNLDAAPESVQLDYGGKTFLRRYNALLNMLLNSPLNSTHVERVVDAYYDSVSAVFPKERYLVGKAAKFFFVPLSMLPACVTDFILRFLLYLLTLATLEESSCVTDSSRPESPPGLADSVTSHFSAALPRLPLSSRIQLLHQRPSSNRRLKSLRNGKAKKKHRLCKLGPTKRRDQTRKSVQNSNKKHKNMFKKDGKLSNSGQPIEHNKWKKRREQIAILKIEAKHKGKQVSVTSTKNSKVVEKSLITTTLAMDCEYVGVGYEGRENCLARVSIVNVDGKCVYDKFVKPTEEVTDFRTHVSGIRYGDVVNGEAFQNVQQEVNKILAGKVVVGHSIHNDFKVLGLTHPAKLTRDTAKYKPLRVMAGNITSMPSLKHLANHLLGVQIQQGEHDSIADAKTALRIYLLHRKKWEEDIKKNQNKQIK